jgi:iron complex outermembrane receptor protein
VSSNLSVDLAPKLQFRSITAARWLSHNQQYDLDGSPYDVISADLRTNARSLSQEFQFASEGNRVFNWIVGAYFNEEDGQEGSDAIALPAINPANPNTTDGEIKNSSWAVFGQGVVSLTDTLRFTGGLRWTSENRVLRSFNRAGPTGAICAIPPNLQLGGNCEAKFDNTFSDYSYLASLDWKPVSGVLLYARTARSFKGGGENLRGTGTDDSFAPFKPEVVTDYEVGFKADFLDRRLRVNGDVYYANYTNIQRTIVQASTSGAIVSLVTNAAKARIQGAELEVIAIPVPGLTLSGSFSLTDAKYKQFVDATGDRSGERFQFPKYSYTLAIAYKLPTSIGDVRAAVDWNWRSDTQLVGSAVYLQSLNQPAYGLLGGRLSLNIKSIDADIAVFGKNLLGKRYAVSATQFDNSLGFNILYAGEPRTFGIQLTKRFGGG